METDTKKQYLDNYYQQFIHTSRYARWIESENRRETWIETVNRYMTFMIDHLKTNNNYEMPYDLEWELREAIINQEVLPSMRALMTAGPALARDNICGYNCSYIPIDNLRAFDETLYILTNGTGVGFSVEEKYTEQLPLISEEMHNSDTVIKVGDSKQGWSGAYRELLAMLYAGQIPKWDTSGVRKAGSRLKTFGGRASGPGPLEELFTFTTDTIRNAAGRKLTSLECHDIVCKIGEVVVVGGVRRSALISLSNLSDLRMAQAKSGNWWEHNPQRRLANNSVAYTRKPDMAAFMNEWKNLYDSKSGERGIFNRQAAKNQAGTSGRRDTNFDFGTNPCSEIILRPNQFCNLSTIVVRETDTEDDLARKVRLATILGTFQATLTKFKYIRKVWNKNTEEERLLGVSMTGQMGHKLLSGQNGLDKLGTTLNRLRDVAVSTNKDIAPQLGINVAAAITCVKPEGTSSQLVLAASGMHKWFSKWYIRTVRIDKKDPVCAFLTDAGIPVEDDLMAPDSTAVFSFPIQAPKNALTRNDSTALEELELWLTYQKSWCEHKPSITVYVREHEWMQVGSWVFDHFDEVSGISFLPHSDHVYKQAPYQEITADEYKEWKKELPTSIDWSILSLYEKEDNTTGTQTLACSAGSCEIVDLVSET